MRYIGNKGKILGEIDGLLKRKGIYRKGLSFFDAFTGTATVAQRYKDLFDVSANDNLYFSYVIAEAKLNASAKMFAELGFDPFEYFNNADIGEFEGFIAKNYAPPRSDRMYFSRENACFIDFIRSTIDEWHDLGKISESEKCFLIASLIESVSSVANVAGVYGAYLKKWDPRALKKMVFAPIDDDPHVGSAASVYCGDIFDVLDKVDGDILYLDPPYTKNQYSVQYHLLETIARYDAPTISGITGARDMRRCASDFSKDVKAHIAFEALIAKAKFKHIVVSYSSDGIMSREYIESVLKRYGKKDTFDFCKFAYRKYTNVRSEDDGGHCEYLFYIEKSDAVTYASPLNFIGGKYDMAEYLTSRAPEDIGTFYDLFGGGFNVGINADAETVVYNDINFKVKELLQYISECDIEAFIKYIRSRIKRLGLQKENKEAYLRLREKYNSAPEDARDCRDLFLLIMYGFQQQIRFNGAHDYNNPVGQACFNDRVLEKLISFSRVAKEKKVEYHSEDYTTFLDIIRPEDFVYIDPPYLITLGSYNDGKRGFNGWNESEERRLLEFLDALDDRGVRFMMSNLLRHKDKENTILAEHIEQRGYNVYYYDERTRGNRAEVIVTNYEVRE